MKKLFYSALLLGGTALAYPTAMASAPDWAQSVQRLFHSVAGYSSDACKSDPVACLQSRGAALEHSRGDIEKAEADLGGEIAKVAAIADDKEMLLAKNVTFLDQGKSVLKGAGLPGQRLDFAGRTYPDAATLRSQLEALFTENQMLRTEVDRSHDLKAKLEARLQQLRGQQGNVQAAIAILPSQVSLMQADASLGALSHNLALIDTALASSDQEVGEASHLIEDTAGLDKRVQDNAGLSAHQREVSDAFDRFLAQ